MSTVVHFVVIFLLILVDCHSQRAQMVECSQIEEGGDVCSSVAMGTRGTKIIKNSYPGKNDERSITSLISCIQLTSHANAVPSSIYSHFETLTSHAVSNAPFVWSPYEVYIADEYM